MASGTLSGTFSGIPTGIGTYIGTLIGTLVGTTPTDYRPAVARIGLPGEEAGAFAEDRRLLMATTSGRVEPLTPLVTIDHVAEVLGVEVRHVRRLVHERRIPFIKWGHLLRFDPEEIQRWVDQHRHQAARPLV